MWNVLAGTVKSSLKAPWSRWMHRTVKLGAARGCDVITSRWIWARNKHKLAENASLTCQVTSLLSGCNLSGQTREGKQSKPLGETNPRHATSTPQQLRPKLSGRTDLVVYSASVLPANYLGFPPLPKKQSHPSSWQLSVPAPRLRLMMDWEQSFLVGQGGNEVWGGRRGFYWLLQARQSPGPLYENHRGWGARKRPVWFIEISLRGGTILFEFGSCRKKKKVLTADHGDRGNVNIMSSVSFPITA